MPIWSSYWEIKYREERSKGIDWKRMKWEEEWKKEGIEEQGKSDGERRLPEEISSTCDWNFYRENRGMTNVTMKKSIELAEKINRLRKTIARIRMMLVKRKKIQ